MRRYLYCVCFASLLSSCASISIKVDIYDGEIPEKADYYEALVQLENLKLEVNEYVNKKRKTFRTLYDLYLNIQEIVMGDEFDASDFNDIYLPAMEEYFAKTQVKVDQLFTAIDLSKAIMQNNISSLSIANIHTHEADINAKLKEVANPLDGNEDNVFFIFIVVDWQERATEFTPKNIKQLTDNRIDEEELKNLKSIMQNQLETLADLNQIKAVTLISMQSQLELATDSASIFSMLNRGKAVIDRIKTSDMVNEIRGIRLIQELHMHSEDYGDPIWRKIITQNADNKNNWKNVYGKTKFKASGRSAVIIARDTPVEFKIKQGENDPKSLIKSQLIVSRALVDLGLAISGLPGGGSTTGQTENSDDVPQKASTDDLELTKKENDFYNKTIEAFDESLKKFEEELIGENDPEKIQAILDRIKEHLATYKLIFETIKTADNVGN